jgi:formate hydrogenlyase subunit 3/multisubunit Na+/H+ antiporter MnhD subunit
MVGCRAVGLAVWALGAANLAVEGEREPRNVGLAAAASLAGALSVAGAPLTAGFPGRWAALELVARTDVWAGGLVVASILVLTVSLVRRATAWGPRMGEPGDGGPWGRRVFLGGGVALVVALGLFPQLLYPWVIQAAQGLQNLMP